MARPSADYANLCDNVGVNIKGSDDIKMLQSGGVTVCEMDFTVEMHLARVNFANSGNNVGLNIRGLDNINMPRPGNVLVPKEDSTVEMHHTRIDFANTGDIVGLNIKGSEQAAAAAGPVPLLKPFQGREH